MAHHARRLGAMVAVLTIGACAQQLTVHPGPETSAALEPAVRSLQAALAATDVPLAPLAFADAATDEALHGIVRRAGHPLLASPAGLTCPWPNAAPAPLGYAVRLRVDSVYGTRAQVSWELRCAFPREPGREYRRGAALEIERTVGGWRLLREVMSWVS